MNLQAARSILVQDQLNHTRPRPLWISGRVYRRFLFGK